jgi:lipopolysaccharide export system protein LptA
MTSEVNGPFISYDNRTEQANVHNDASGESKAGGGRGTIIIAPRRTAPAATPAAAPAGKQ